MTKDSNNVPIRVRQLVGGIDVMDNGASAEGRLWNVRDMIRAFCKWALHRQDRGQRRQFNDLLLLKINE